MEKSAILVSLAVFGILHTQMVVALYSNSCNKTALIQEDKELGLRGGKIPDTNIEASSYSDSQHKPERGRLDQKASGNQASSWCSKHKDKKQFLLIKLAYISRVTGIATQGQYDPVNKTTNYTTSWVTQYTVEYSHDNKTFYPIEYKYDRPLIFKGNSDGDSVVCNNFPYAIKTNYVRVQPLAWNTSLCLRVGLFGERLEANFTIDEPFVFSNDQLDHETWWWWIYFWVIMANLLLLVLVGLLIYCCIIRRRVYAQEKVLKEKPVKAPIQRRPESYVNDAYDMTVITNKTSLPDTPEDVEDTGDEIQEVTAEFTADEQENQKGIVGFSVTDDTKDDSDIEANGDVTDWDTYKKRALSKRSEHSYENVDLKPSP